MPQERVAETLRFMHRTSDEPITEALGREIGWVTTPPLPPAGPGPAAVVRP